MTGVLLGKFVADAPACFDDTPAQFFAKVIDVDFDGVGLPVIGIFEEQVGDGVLRKNASPSLQEELEEVEFHGRQFDR